MKTLNLLGCAISTLFILSHNTEAKAVAAYDGLASIELIFPGAKTNLFGFANNVPFAPIALGVSLEIDNANAIFLLPTVSSFEVPIVPPPSDGQNIRVGRKIENLGVAGSAGPGNGYAYSLSQGAISANLGNFSGTGAGIPSFPPQIFNATFDIKANFILNASTDDPTIEYSDIQFGVYARAKSKGAVTWTRYYDTLVSLTADGSVAGALDDSFTVPLPPSMGIDNISTTLFELQYYIQGRAISKDPLPVIPILPEPTPVPGPGGFVGALVTYRFCRSIRLKIRSASK